MAPPGFTPGRVQVRVDTGLIANRVTTGPNPSVQYSACGQATNAGPGGVTLTVQMTVFLPNGDVYPVTGSATQRLSGLGAWFGCGLVTIIDRNLSHPDPVRYRLHFHYVFDDHAEGDVEAEAAFR